MVSKALETAFFLTWAAITVVFSYWLGQQAYSWMPPQATYEAQRVDQIFSFLVALGSVVFMWVFGMIAHSIAVCRAPHGDFSEGHPSRGSARLEVLWTVVPAMLVIWIGVQGSHIYSLLDVEGTGAFSLGELPSEIPKQAALLVADPESDPRSKPKLSAQAAIPPETIEVTAQQWAWSFYYPEQGVTSNELHVPLNRRTRLVMTSKDVLHGFYVPAFRLKQDIIPGQNIDLVISPRLKGQYQLQDSQFSGTYFSLMVADVYVDDLEDYQQWISNAPPYPIATLPTLAEREHANQPHLWGEHWAVNAPDEFLKSVLKATVSPTAPNS